MMRMDKHAGWGIGVAATARSGGQWSARIKVWNPGTEPPATVGRAVPFINRHNTRRVAEREAIAFAKRWIDRQR
jgi:hypothetical protein